MTTSERAPATRRNGFEVSEITAAPGPLRRDARPPITMDPAPTPGAAVLPPAAFEVLRATAKTRPMVRPLPWEDVTSTLGYPPDHGYVRRYWTAALGPGAVADLLRLTTAAARGRSVKRPTHLGPLVRAGLARVIDGRLEVRTRIPPLGRSQVQLLPPALRRELAGLHLETRIPGT